MSRAITGLIVHHSAGPVSETVGAIDHDHRRRGWRCIGYHLIVRRDPLFGWVVAGGRPLEQEGAHDKGQNRGTIGICLLGDYSDGVPPEPAAWALLVGLLAGLLLRYQLPVTAIEGHGEHEPPGHGTACPGIDPGALRRAVGRTCIALTPGREG